MSEALARQVAKVITGVDAAETILAAKGMSSAAWRVLTNEGAIVVRVPIPNSDRRLTYRTEETIGATLADQGHPVARWTVVEFDGLTCSVAPELPGRPVQDCRWGDAFAHGVADVLRATHGLAHRGAGPLQERGTDELEGISDGLISGICDRWFHAAIWPFDRTELTQHAVAKLAPELVEALRGRRAEISTAGARGPHGVCHSDLHAEHLLVDDRGRLSGLLDFGDAFIGAIAWDFALLLHYYGEANTYAVLKAYTAEGTATDALLAQAKSLAIAVALYKVAKSPDRPELVDNLRAALNR